MAKKSTAKEAPEVTPEKKTAKKAAASAETKPKSAKSKTAKIAAPEEPKHAKTAKPRKKASAKPMAPETPAASPETVEEHIRVAAYYRWVERGMTDGGHEEDWIAAEKQIKG
ncbi:MAG TPA: DUF2934 domain-containing protein [Chlorobaculum sp.]|uniref:DUF2934 domain-containing protein n=1 Tax=Chlorobaculum tepidum (strain ATCC 49652 / DSM 12025 / NBRC 103806 / TLS) TaxID=194439 RepID=Q8KD53_CHLTE|nr:DUF2934 domain-containing protein [Chlorobaculum tepidum]AAM72434.1 hypothetical protein CT1201 [Chlorobaculum tepidum TLS]HBU23926.1 DUF2934 domain-containing protein [Chlorobaculum sp.]